MPRVLPSSFDATRRSNPHVPSRAQLLAAVYGREPAQKKDRALSAQRSSSPNLMMRGGGTTLAATKRSLAVEAAASAASLSLARRPTASYEARLRSGRLPNQQGQLTSTSSMPTLALLAGTHTTRRPRPAHAHLGLHLEP